MSVPSRDDGAVQIDGDAIRDRLIYLATGLLLVGFGLTTLISGRASWLGPIQSGAVTVAGACFLITVGASVTRRHAGLPADGGRP